MILDQGFIASLISSTLIIATPILLVSSLELVSQRSGVINLGVEGVMLLGAFAAYIVTLQTSEPYLGLLAAVASGSILSFIFGILAIYMRFDQIVAGISISMFSLGLTSYLYRISVGYGPLQKIVSLERMEISIPEIPIISEILSQNFLTYIALLLPLVIKVILDRGSVGILIKASGEDPNRACRLGVDVSRLRISLLALEGIAAGASGALLSIGYYSSFLENMTAGRGYLAVALVILSGWSPIKLLLASIFFSLLEASQLRLQASGVFEIPYQFTLAIPYISTLAILAIYRKNIDSPRSLGSSERGC
jgi:simple sugar transport system permease protein